MNRQEFEQRATHPISDSDYTIVEKVYTYHPCIADNGGKEQIARLYDEFGMRVILDMLPTAEKAAELEEKILAARRELNKLTAEYNALKGIAE